MTQGNTQQSELSALRSDDFDRSVAVKNCDAAPPVVSWSVDVGAAVGVESPSVASVTANTPVEQSAASDVPVSGPRRGLSRLSPKTDARAVRRREKLRKIRRELKSSTDTGLPREEPKGAESVEAKKGSRSVPSAESAEGSKVGKSGVTKRSKKKSVPTEQVVRSQVVAEIASLVSQKLKTSTKQKPKRKSPAKIPTKVESVEAAVPAEVPLFETVAPAISLAEPVPAEEERYSDWLRRVVLKNRWMSVLTTFYVHWLILLALAAIIVHGPENAASLLINATFAADEPLEEASFEVIVAEPQPIQETVESKPEPAATQPARLAESSLALDEAVLDKIAPDAPDAGTDSKQPSESEAQVPAKSAAGPNPAPVRAISKGSFSVWTEPTSPQAGEPYRIVIQVCLPNGLERYNVADLQGVVVGSDGYRKPIPGFLRGFLPVENGYARLIIPIVSADEKVQDTVFIRSRVLKETQKLLIQFEPNL